MTYMFRESELTFSPSSHGRFDINYGQDKGPSFIIIPNPLDTLIFQDELGAVTVDLTAGLGIPALPVGAALSDIHNLIGSDFDDILTGASLETVGSVATSYIMGGLGADVIDGGTSLARASFANATSGVIASVDFGGVFGEAAGDSQCQYWRIYRV